VVDLDGLQQILQPALKPGSVIHVLLEKPGEAKGQATGHLGDGSLVVVADAAESIGQTVEVTVLRLHPTANGRMVFATRGG
jgi:uncharacterized protein YacL